MRYLFTTVPSTSFMLPLVPLAQAAPAGHEVAGATDDGNAVEPYEELGRTVTEMLLTESYPGPKTAAYVGAVFGEVGARMVDGVVTTAREWNADATLPGWWRRGPPVCPRCRTESPYTKPVNPDAVRAAPHELLDDPAYRRAGLEVADEMRALPAPSTVIGRLTAHLEEIR